MLADGNSKKPHTAMGRTGMVVIVASILAMGAAGSAAHYAHISGAIIASGQAMVRGKPKAIQHLDGGVVEALLVDDGSVVAKGDPLVRFDSTLLKANLGIYESRLTNALALQARLSAEQTGADAIEFGSASKLLEGVDQSMARARQKSIFETKRMVREGRREQLEEKIKQFANQVKGIKALIEAKREQIGYVERELMGLQKLLDKKLVRETQLMAVQSNRADLAGQLGEHQAELSRIENSVRDTRIEILQIDRQTEEAASTELDNVTSRIDELVPQLISTRIQLGRVVVTAPVAGIVHEMQVATIGGVVPPGAMITQVIPVGSGTEFQVRIEPAHVDQVFSGQNVRLVLSAFNQQTTPELNGTIRSVSPNSIPDEATGLSFYRAWVDVTPKQLKRLGTLKIVPGMPVEAFIETQSRSVFSYISKPITDQFRRALREE